MLKKIITILSFSLITINVSLACDLDGDGLTEVLTYENENELRWNVVYSSNDQSETLNTPGGIDSLPAPGNYFGGTQDYLGSLNFNDFFWRVISPSDEEQTLNFGFPDARSYIAGQDFNGDGVTDLAKFIGGCIRLRKSCHNSRAISGNFLFNSTNGTDTFVNSGISTTTGVFGRGLSAIVTLDVNEDGRDDICYTLPRTRRDPRTFKLVCKDIQSGDRVKRTNIGKLFTTPLAINIANKDYLVLWRRRRQNVRLTFENFTDNITFNETPSIVMDKGTTPIVGKWQAGNTEQIAFVVGGNKLHIFNPLTRVVTIKDLPEGTPLTCKNNFKGITNTKILTTRNACRVFDCDAS